MSRRACVWRFGVPVGRIKEDHVFQKACYLFIIQGCKCILSRTHGSTRMPRYFTLCCSISQSAYERAGRRRAAETDDIDSSLTPVGPPSSVCFTGECLRVEYMHSYTDKDKGVRFVKVRTTGTRTLEPGK